MDERGHVVDGDLILYVCGVYLNNHGRLSGGTVIPTVMSNFGVLKAFEQANLNYEITAVGDKNVFACMHANGYSLGGEQSGHIIFSKYASTGDGVLTSLKLMEVVLERKAPMSKLLEGLTIYPQVLETLVRGACRELFA